MHDDKHINGELARTRAEIDHVDGELIDLLARRRVLVSQIADFKRHNGLPVYVPEREAAMLRDRADEAEARGVPSGLVQDILRRIMRESYRDEGQSGFRCAAPVARPVVLIGGAGGMGSLFARHFDASGYPVRVLDRDDWDRSADLLSGAGLVLVGVPIAETPTVIETLRGRLPSDAILADITSVKAAPLAGMLDVHDGPVVGLHPMFGHGVPSLAKQVVVHCPGRDDEGCRWLLDQLRIWGASLVMVDPSRHDRLMGAIQAQRHFATFVYGMHLMEEETDLDEILSLSSPIYRLELGMVGRLFAQEPELYADIIYGSPEGRELAKSYHRLFGELLAAYDKGDRTVFMDGFEQVKTWLGPLAETFLIESDALLDQARDRIDRPTDHDVDATGPSGST